MATPPSQSSLKVRYKDFSQDSLRHDPASFMFEREESLKTSTRRDCVLIVLNQPVNARKSFYDIYDACEWRIYADGGADRVRALSKHRDFEVQNTKEAVTHGYAPEIIVGDLDSLTKATERHYIAKGVLVVEDPDQYSTDFGKAVKAINSLRHFPSNDAFRTAAQSRRREQQRSNRRLQIKDFVSMCDVSMKEHAPEQHSSNDGAIDNAPIEVIVFCGLGGRLDQGIGVLAEMSRYQAEAAQEAQATGQEAKRFWLVSEQSLSWILDGPECNDEAKTRRHILQLSPNGSRASAWPSFTRNIGILPVFGPAFISTNGLEWDVSDWKTDMSGQVSTSNHVVSKDGVIEVTTNAKVLFTVELSENQIDKFF